MSAVGLFPAGWAVRRFELDELEALTAEAAPKLVEISKDFLREDISLKALAAMLDRLRAACSPTVAFAGTTDLVGCAGWPWTRYREYLAVQIAQARFLGCSLFRVFVGRRSENVDEASVVERLEDLCADLAPLTACIEIHGGIECEDHVLHTLLRDTSAEVLVDIERCRAAGATESLLRTVPLDRVAYFHQRNLPQVWTEHPASLEDEQRWHLLAPDASYLWEPKTVDEPRRIRELFGEYRRSH
ncbi:MAG: hypothetical protein AB7Q29_16340 [Vicinamibacterales bacterium]